MADQNQSPASQPSVNLSGLAYPLTVGGSPTWQAKPKLSLSVSGTSVAATLGSTSTTNLLGAGHLLGKNSEISSTIASGIWTLDDQISIKRGLSSQSLPPAATDPYFSNVSLLLHMDGSNGSTTFTDSSSVGATITPVGDAKLSTAQVKYGTAAGFFDGNGDRLTFTQISIGTANCTMECWIRPASVSDVGIFGNYNGPNYQLLAILSGDLYAYWDGSQIQTTGAPIVANTWYHVAITRQSSTLRLFIDGVLKSTATISAGAVLITPNQVGKCVYRGDFNGYIDDVRITNGVARYTTNFTPPAAAFPNA